MKTIAVTTFNRSGLDKYGRRMLASFEKNWPKEIELRCYFEGWDARDVETASDRITYLDLEEKSPWLTSFKNRNASRNDDKGFKKNAIRFSHKVAALCHAGWETNADWVIWIDGDVYTHAPIDLAALESYFPKGNEWVAYLDRGGRYPECGFYIINCRHPLHYRLFSTFEDMYAKDRLFALPEWHDSFVLWSVVKQSNALAKHLSRGYAARTGHPFVNVFGHWMDHLKGSRKDALRSHDFDLIAPRKEAYWQGNIQK
jgi:hypothetical protein